MLPSKLTDSKLERIERLAWALVVLLVVTIVLGTFMVQTMSPGVVVPLCEKGCKSQTTDTSWTWPLMML